VKPLLALLSLLALPVMAAEPTLYGRYENIALPELGETLKAKMDTGAYTASLSAKDIELFTRDGEEWVRFRLATKDADGKVYEHKFRASARSRTAPTRTRRAMPRVVPPPGGRPGAVPG
jgi:hypothetical protein